MNPAAGVDEFVAVRRAVLAGSGVGFGGMGMEATSRSRTMRDVDPDEDQPALGRHSRLVRDHLVTASSILVMLAKSGLAYLLLWQSLSEVNAERGQHKCGPAPGSWTRVMRLSAGQASNQYSPGAAAAARPLGLTQTALALRLWNPPAQSRLLPSLRKCPARAGRDMRNVCPATAAASAGLSMLCRVDLCFGVAHLGKAST